MDPENSTTPCVDRLAWAGFGVGLIGMLGVAFISLVSESDGDYRTWEQIRFHRDLFLSAAGLAVLWPMAAVSARTSLRLRKFFGHEKPPADDLDDRDD